MEISEWIVIDECYATRVMKGADPEVVENRVAFIEKSPRVKTRNVCITTKGKLSCIGLDRNESAWIYGDCGTGGSGDHEEMEQYGFDPESRKWCDDMLKLLGYEF